MGWLVSAAWLCSAQSTQNAVQNLPDAPAVAHAVYAEFAGVPPAKELSDPPTAETSQNQPGQNQPGQSQPETQKPQEPAGAPSLGDLGFTPQQTEANAKLQATLNRRTQMLKIHQRLGLITAIPMAAALITGPMISTEDKNGQTVKIPSQANLDFHAALGGATTLLYGATAYYAIRAPKIPGTQTRGAIRLHRALAFVHGTGMIATPILGAMAFKQEQAGENVHGIASAHGAVAWSTAVAYGAALVSVSWPIKLKF